LVCAGVLGASLDILLHVLQLHDIPFLRGLQRQAPAITLLSVLMVALSLTVQFNAGTLLTCIFIAILAISSKSPRGDPHAHSPKEMTAFVEILSGIVRAGPGCDRYGKPYEYAVAFSSVDGKTVIGKALVSGGQLKRSHIRVAKEALGKLGLGLDWERIKEEVAPGAP
jgi:hypothetical protein